MLLAYEVREALRNPLTPQKKTNTGDIEMPGLFEKKVGGMKKQRQKHTKIGYSRSQKSQEIRACRITWKPGKKSTQGNNREGLKTRG